MNKIILKNLGKVKLQNLKLPHSEATNSILNKNQDFSTSTGVGGRKIAPLLQAQRRQAYYYNKTPKLPIKCRLKLNECGQKIPETYEAKTPRCVELDPLKKDFTMISEENCEKLQSKVFTCPKSAGDFSTTNVHFRCPNALTKYLKGKGECQDIFRGCQNEEPCRKKDVLKSVYRGRDCSLEDPCRTGKRDAECKIDLEEPSASKTKILLDKLLTKLKPSGYISEEFITETISKLTSKRANQKTSVKPTFGPRLSHLETGNKFWVRTPKMGTKVEEKTSAKKNPKSKNVGRRKKRRSRFWFSKIPQPPNVKGSVIFANGTEQILEDPCKILAVNFSNTDHEVVQQKEDVFLEDCDYIVKQLVAKNVGFNEVEEVKTTGESYRDTSCLEEVKVAVVRQKKISKLDNTVKTYNTKVKTPVTPKRTLPVKPKDPTSSPNASWDYWTFSDVLCKNYQDIKSHSSRFYDYWRPRTCASRDFEVDIENSESNFKGSVSFVKLKEPVGVFESAEELKDVEQLCKRGDKRADFISPGVTRPVTGKAAHLDILKSKVFTPISNTWKSGTASTGRLLVTKEKNSKKKPVVKSTNNILAHQVQETSFQQTRSKSTKSTSWRTKCDNEKKPSQNKKIDTKLTSLPPDFDYDSRAPEEIARKWGNWECPREKLVGCPITNEDLKNGIPQNRPPNAAALNRCNFEECQNKLKCRKPASKCRTVGKKPVGSGK